MIKTVEKFLDKYDLKKPENTFFVGFSGGYDSLCLLDILHNLSTKYGFKLVALHLNHNWRGEESLKEEHNCKNFCKKIGIEFISETLENNGQKDEKTARKARYDFFLKHTKNIANSFVLTAHNKTDNAETLIYRIIKGTGIEGLKGIPEKREIEGISVFRPLLEISRREIKDYCNSKGLAPNIDSSNFDINYKRNFIRHKIMPLFDEINFHSEKSIASLIKLAISESNIVNEYLNLIKKDIFKNEKILTQKFITLTDDIQQKLVYELFLDKNLDYDFQKIENALNFIRENSNSKAGSKCSLTNNLWLFVNHEFIYPISDIKPEKKAFEIQIAKEGVYQIPEINKAFSLEKYSNKVDDFPSENAPIAYVDLSNLDFNFTVRTRREGDFITPFGMQGSMKLKKYLNSKGIAQHEKDRLILLCQGSEVLWVVGVGLSNKLKVVNQTSHVLEFRNKDK